MLTLNSFGRWLVACTCATALVSLQYGWRYAAMTALGVTGLWVMQIEARKQ